MDSGSLPPDCHKIGYMFIILSKFIPLLFYPAGLLWIGILAGLILLWRNKKRAARIIFISLFVLIWVSGNSWVSESLLKSLEWQYLPGDYPPESAQVIVVLGGGTESQIYPRPEIEVNGAGDRIFYAARLYRQKAAPLILATGGNITWMGGRTTSPAEEIASLLKLLDVPDSAIILQKQSQNTYEDALYSRPVLEKMGIHKIILVTSAAHMPRSVGVFRKQGFEVIPAPVDYSITRGVDGTSSLGDSIISFIFNCLPTIGNIGQTTNALKEYIGTWMYGLRGWL